MKTQNQITTSVEQTIKIAYDFTSGLRPNDVVVLSGDLAAGKTHFVQGAAKALGIEAQIISPTFNIVLQYEEGNIALYHFDLYRLDDALELEDIAFYDIIESGGISFIEWGEKFIEQMPDEFWHVIINKIDETSRNIKFERVKNV